MIKAKDADYPERMATIRGAWPFFTIFACPSDRSQMVLTSGFPKVIDEMVTIYDNTIGLRKPAGCSRYLQIAFGQCVFSAKF